MEVEADTAGWMAWVEREEDDGPGSAEVSEQRCSSGDEKSDDCWLDDPGRDCDEVENS